MKSQLTSLTSQSSIANFPCKYKEIRS